MPDICMCLDYGCEKKSNCYRYTAIPTMHPHPVTKQLTNYQSYFEESPRTEKGCEYYWPNKKEMQEFTKI